MDTVEAIGKVLGIPAIAQSIKAVTETSCSLTERTFTAFIEPVLQSSGLFLKEIVDRRRENARTIAAKADELRIQGTKLNPMIAGRILDAGSYTDDPMLQDMWAGLLASSCTEAGDDDSNQVLMNLVANMTRNQAKIIDWLGKHPQHLTINPDGSVTFNSFFLSRKQFREITAATDDMQLKSEIELLGNNLGLIHLNMAQPTNNPVYHIALSQVGLFLFIRCQGSRMQPAEFYNLSPA